MAIEAVTASATAAQSPAARALARSLLGAARPASSLWAGGADSPRKSRLFGLAIDNTRLERAARDMAQAARDKRAMRVVFVNAHGLNTAMADPSYRATVDTADRIFADGSGMAIASRMCGQPLIDNVNGTDLFPLLCREAIAAGTKIFLLGGKPGIAGRAAASIAEFGMGEAIAGTHHGYFEHGSAEEDRVIGAINASGAGIVLVAMGVPLQDQWARRNASRLDARVVAGVGGLFDFFSGAISRSPKFMRSLGCEWVWRLALEPARMGQRYLIGNAVFLAHAAREAAIQRGFLNPVRGVPTTGKRIPELG